MEAFIFQSFKHPCDFFRKFLLMLQQSFLALWLESKHIIYTAARDLVQSLMNIQAAMSTQGA